MHRRMEMHGKGEGEGTHHCHGCYCCCLMEGRTGPVDGLVNGVCTFAAVRSINRIVRAGVVPCLVRLAESNRSKSGDALTAAADARPASNQSGLDSTEANRGQARMEDRHAAASVCCVPCALWKEIECAAPLASPRLPRLLRFSIRGPLGGALARCLLFVCEWQMHWTIGLIAGPFTTHASDSN
jgi:hypothetical protein